jgi:hypothetical protein
MGRFPSSSPRQGLPVLAELDDYDDLRDAYARVLEGIRHFERTGSPVPEELLRCERDMVIELAAQSQGR